MKFRRCLNQREIPGSDTRFQKFFTDKLKGLADTALVGTGDPRLIAAIDFAKQLDVGFDALDAVDAILPVHHKPPHCRMSELPGPSISVYE